MPSRRRFRCFFHGYRRVGGSLVQSAVRVEEYIDGKWVYDHAAPDWEAAQQAVASVGGEWEDMDR